MISKISDEKKLSFEEYFTKKNNFLEKFETTLSTKNISNKIDQQINLSRLMFFSKTNYNRNASVVTKLKGDGKVKRSVNLIILPARPI